MSSVSGGIYWNGIHLSMLWLSPGAQLLLWGEMIQQLHEAQAHVSPSMVSICTLLMFMFTLPNAKCQIHYLSF